MSDKDALYDDVLAGLRKMSPDLRKKAFGTLKREREESRGKLIAEQKLLPNEHWSKAHILRRIANPTVEAYEQKILIPELTFMGVGNQPDFGEVLITFYPKEWTIELKSLKQYKDAFRDSLASYERLANVVFDDLIKVYDPIRLRVMMNLRPRGGISSSLTIDSDWKIRGGNETFRDWAGNVDSYGFDRNNAGRV
ncbi:MAG: NADPH-dependent 7-cyano-7-deazaguanine reductase [Myxococcota bacterium]